MSRKIKTPILKSKPYPLSRADLTGHHDLWKKAWSWQDGGLGIFRSDLAYGKEKPSESESGVEKVVRAMIICGNRTLNLNQLRCRLPLDNIPQGLPVISPPNKQTESPKVDDWKAVPGSRKKNFFPGESSKSSRASQQQPIKKGFSIIFKAANCPTKAPIPTVPKFPESSPEKAVETSLPKGNAPPASTEIAPPNPALISTRNEEGPKVMLNISAERSSNSMSTELLQPALLNIKEFLNEDDLLQDEQLDEEFTEEELEAYLEATKPNLELDLGEFSENSFHSIHTNSTVLKLMQGMEVQKTTSNSGSSKRKTNEKVEDTASSSLKRSKKSKE